MDITGSASKSSMCEDELYRAESKLFGPVNSVITLQSLNKLKFIRAIAVDV